MRAPKRRVVLVEDNADDRAILEAALRSEAPEVDLDVVTSAAEALEHLADIGVPLDDVIVVSDVQLGEIDGIDLLTQLRSDPDLDQIAVIMLSTSMRAADVRRAYAAGCNGYFTKPLTFEATRQLLRSLVDYWFDSEARPV